MNKTRQFKVSQISTSAPRGAHVCQHIERKHIMDKKHSPWLLSLAGLVALTAQPAFAQDSSYYYGGLGVGQSRAKIDEPRITASLLSGGLSTTGMTRDERDTGYRIFGGYQFNRYIALEAGYFSLGKFGFTSTTVPAGTLNGQIELRGVNLDLVGALPLSERWSLLARAGAQFARASDRFSGTGAVSVLNPNPSKKETNFKYGGGVQYAFSPSFLVRVEAEHYRVNDAVGNHGGVNMVSVSAVFPFGRAPEAPRARAAPAYGVPVRELAQAPKVAEAPVVAVAQPPAAVAEVVPPRRRVTFTADLLFGFDRSQIRPEGKIVLDSFIQELVGMRYEVIVVEGHADRLGAAKYNQTLSMQRADAVKAYLVTAGGLDSGKISAVAVGETRPVTKPDECRGTKATASLIDCLQPDRGVDVEVIGTR